MVLQDGYKNLMLWTQRRIEPENPYMMRIFWFHLGISCVYYWNILWHNYEMRERNKTALNGFLTVTTLLLTSFFWQRPLLLMFLLCAVGVAMVITEQHKSAIPIYVVAFLFGPLSETPVIYFGAWSYAEPHIGNIPIWLPFVWGNAGLFLNRVNNHIRLRFNTYPTYKSEP